MQVERTASVTREVHIDASPETVFSFFTDPVKMARWKGAEVQAEPIPGGLYRLVVNAGAIATGSYVEIDPPRRVVFTWGWEGNELVPPGSSTVEITLTPDGDGTRVVLHHFDLPVGEDVPHGEGWDHFLPRLVIAAAGASRDRLEGPFGHGAGEVWLVIPLEGRWHGDKVSLRLHGVAHRFQEPAGYGLTH